MKDDRIITPTSDPDRWNEEETRLYDLGLCSWQTGFGNWRPSTYCEAPSKRGASFGHCAAHEQQLLDEGGAR